MRVPAAFLAPLLVALLVAAPARAEDVQIQTSVDAGEIHEGESFSFVISVQGPMRGSEAPVLPDLDDFALVGTSSSSSFSFVNGKTSSTKTYRYTLLPLRSGPLEIPAIPVRVKGKEYFSRPLNLNVRAATNAAPRPAMPRANVPIPGAGSAASRAEAQASGAGDDQVFIRSWVDREQVWVGQQLTHHFGLFRRPTLSFLGTPQYSPPDVTGFWSEALGDEISGFRRVQGQQYAVTELRRALFPNEPGELTIGEAGVQLRLRDRGRFEFFSFDSGPEKLLRTKPLTIQVKALPDEGKPADFSGTVAEGLDLTLRLDAGPYEVGQPITVTLKLSGFGNPRTFAEPAYEVGEDFKSYDAELQSVSRVDEERIRVEKTFTRVVVPRRDGELTLPGARYAWFDPAAGEYRSKTTPARAVQVAPSTSREADPVVFSELNPERVELLGRDIHHIKTDPALAGDGERFPRSAAFWTFLALPWPLLAGTLIWRKRRDALAADAAGTRARGARKSAGLRLKAAAAARSAGDYDAFCAELAAGLRGYLGDRLGLSAGFTMDAAGQALTAAGAPAELRDRTMQLLADCDFARYAPGGDGGARMESLHGRAETLLGELDANTRRRGGRPGLGGALLSLCLLLAAVGAPRASVDAELRMAEGAAQYEAGGFSRAADTWESLAREGLEDSRLWYNLGNAYFQQGDMGRAILDYRRALRLAPRDAELRDNLELARSRRVDGDAPLAGGGPIAGLWRWLRARVSTGELAVLGLVVLWVGTILLLLGILRRASWRRLRWPLVAVALLLPLLSAAAWTAEWQDWSGREAVLLAPVVKVSSGPGADFITLFEIHAGAELRLREERGNWVRVNLGEDLEGWVPRGSFETL